jgi:hypothetical protein
MPRGVPVPADAALVVRVRLLPQRRAAQGMYY